VRKWESETKKPLIQQGRLRWGYAAISVDVVAPLLMLLGLVMSHYSCGSD
jgi:hypothetical protein